MSSTSVIINYSISGLVTMWAIYRIYQLIISEESLKKAIEINLNTEKFKVESVSRLSLTERIKYGVPMPVLGFYNYFFGIFTGKIDYTRKVELTNMHDEEIIKFISISVKKRNVISIKKFDNYIL